MIWRLYSKGYYPCRRLYLGGYCINSVERWWWLRGWGRWKWLRLVEKERGYWGEMSFRDGSSCIRYGRRWEKPRTTSRFFSWVIGMGQSTITLAGERENYVLACYLRRGMRYTDIKYISDLWPWHWSWYWLRTLKNKDTYREPQNILSWSSELITNESNEFFPFLSFYS